MKLLLVEDDLWLGELYQRQLRAAGHEVRWCRDGYQAIDALDDQLADVLVLDMLLPWANGLQLLHEMASHVDTAVIPVVLCSSALPRELTLEQLQPYGVRAMLDKTKMRPRDLVVSVEAVYASI